MTKQQMTSVFGKKKVAVFALMFAAFSLLVPFSLIGNASAAANSSLSALAEQANFRVLLSSAIHLGDDGGVGDDYEITFSAPEVDATKTAILMIRTRDVDFSRNVITINGVAVSNALVPHSDDNDGEYFTEIGIVAANTLRATNNKLYIGARNESGTIGGNLDDFDVDNVVLVYKQP